MLLWLTRKFPPSVGGMERLNYELTRHLGRRFPLRVVGWGGSQRALPLYFVRAAASALDLRRQGGRVRGVHLGDALLLPLGVAVSRLFAPAPLTATVNGLDLTYALAPYQAMIRRGLPACSRLICISTATLVACLQRGAAPERCRVIPPGATPGPHLAAPDATARQEARAALARRLGRDLGDRPILLTVGRLVRRKGVAWFVGEVMPRLVARGGSAWHVVVGEGPDRRRIGEAARRSGVGGLVLAPGRLSTPELSLAYAAADLFLMPNVPVPNDPEGFGIAALDASVAGLWVVAARLQGIPDAVLDGVNGTLLPPQAADTWAAYLSDALGDPLACRRRGATGRQATLDRFAWSAVADRYGAEFAELGVAG